MRTPAEIAAEARNLIDTSSRAFVPPSLVRIGELSVEFMEASAAAGAASDEAFLQLGQAVTHVQAEIEALKPTA